MYLKKILLRLSSLKIAITCLALSMVLIFWGTLAQVNLGIYAVQLQYFESFFVYWRPFGANWMIPIFPGGYLIGSVLLINLVTSLIWIVQWRWKKTGIILIHIGFIILLAGEFLTDFFAVESYMRLDEGETKNHSESSRKTELVIIDITDPAYDEVISIPESVLYRKQIIEHAKLPFLLKIKKFYPNSRLKMRLPAEKELPPASTQGIGKDLVVAQVPMTAKTDERNLPAVRIEISGNNQTQGTWLVSNQLDAPQRVTYQNRSYQIALRQVRYYKPYRMQLLDFTHDRYAGTDIPKNFSSRIHLSHPARNEDRDVLIYMNHPLRYEGETYYQASFDNDDTTSILQVVRNPSWLLPYISSGIIGIGMLFQFMIHLMVFLKRRI
ncbi:MAG: ResB protein required for cytochrome C biosynthesis [Kiritimatiellae bacterium]|nr:ResB protein required for cytochrome C biosynthesis [Kiritimatiellia bacterium]